MNLIEKYKKKSYSLLSSIVEKYLVHFENLRPDLEKSGINLTLREYLSIAFMTIIVTFSIEFPLLAFIIGFIPGFGIGIAFLLSFTISIFISVIFFFFFYIYPSMRVSSRKKRIDYELPFATIYMATTSGGDTPPSVMFKILSEFEQYPEISKEAKKVKRDMELFGMDVTESIRKVASKTPSEEFKELLWGLNTTINAGGNITNYLHEKARGYMDDYRRKLNQYSNTLSTLLEIYLTLIIVGSMFFIAMTAMMSVFGFGAGMRGIILIAQTLVIFVFLPLVSIGFVYLLKTVSPRGG